MNCHLIIPLSAGLIDYSELFEILGFCLVAFAIITTLLLVVSAFLVLRREADRGEHIRGRNAANIRLYLALMVFLGGGLIAEKAYQEAGEYGERHNCKRYDTVTDTLRAGLLPLPGDGAMSRCEDGKWHALLRTDDGKEEMRTFSCPVEVLRDAEEGGEHAVVTQRTYTDPKSWKSMAKPVSVSDTLAPESKVVRSKHPHS